MNGYTIELADPLPALILLPITIATLLYIVRSIRLKKNVLRQTLYYSEKSFSKLLIVFKLVVPFLLLIGISQPMLVVERNIVIDTIDEVKNYSGELPVNYIVLIDVSPSMYRGENIDQALDTLYSLLKFMNRSDYIVLSVFAGEVYELYRGPVSNVSNYIPMITTYKQNYTAIGTALSWALSYASISPLPTIVFVLSDGANNYGGDPLEAVETLNKSGVPVIFIKIGDDPRGYELYSELIRRGYTVVDPSGLSRDQLEGVAENLVYESKLLALKIKGKAYVKYRDYEPLSPYLILLPATLLYIVSRVEGLW
ncbi:MAG: hypothetical protein B6U89_03865 [Desulfurococcales archaeon ex4484_58]|nr:MAG: hypothetical protein B6U89_03865 [Desulfurococcales archaeon ex4484_58]